MGLRSFQESALLGALGKRSANGKVLVLIQLNGGNDGLNTIIPLDQYSNLTKARSNVIMDESKVIKTWVDKVGLHPGLAALNNKLFAAKKMSIVQSVGYPQPNFSHFRATDIWMSASDSNTVLTTGWMGRYLDKQYAGFPTGYPNATMPDPLAIQIGPLVSLNFMGPNTNMGMAITDPSTFYNLVDNNAGSVPNTPAGDELAYIRLLAQQTNKYATVIKAAAAKGTNKSTMYPTGTRMNLGEQLKIVAKLISGGLKTPVYMVSLGGFDTHSAQVDSADTTEGSHADLMTHLSQSIAAFQDDLELLGVSDKVAGMTFSEFGRRIKSNSSQGTDHGAAAPVIFFGSMLNTSSHVKKSIYPVSGMIGKSPNLPLNASVNDQVEMQFDYRQLYTTVMQDWLCMTEAEATQVLGSNFIKLPIYNNTLLSSADFDNDDILLYPNPSKDNIVYLRFPNIVNDYVSIDLLSINGQVIKSEVIKLNQKELQLDYSGYVQDALYILSIERNGKRIYKKVVFN
jgi:uncharacterized protein (DUF1501 family)